MKKTMYLLLCCIAVMSILLQSCGSKDTVSATTVSEEKPLPEDAQVYGEYDGKTFYIIEDDNTVVQMYIRRSTGEDVKIFEYGDFQGVQFHRQNKNIVLIIADVCGDAPLNTCRIDITKETFEGYYLYASGFDVSKDGITYSMYLPFVRDKYGNVPKSYLKFTFPELFNESLDVLHKRWESQMDADEEKYKEEDLSRYSWMDGTWEYKMRSPYTGQILKTVVTIDTKQKTIIIRDYSSYEKCSFEIEDNILKITSGSSVNRSTEIPVDNERKVLYADYEQGLKFKKVN